MREAIIGGVIGGFIVAVISAAVTVLWWFSLRHRRHRRLTGSYRIRRKLEPEIVCERVEVNVRGHKLEAESDDYSGGSYRATIVMSDDLKDTGRGHYTNLRGGERLWGFLEVQVVKEDDTLHVHETYISQQRPGSPDRKAVRAAYVWEHIDV